MLSSKSNKDKVQLFAPIWLEEIQNNKIYKKYSERNQKIDEDKTQENETEVSDSKITSLDEVGGEEEKNLTDKKDIGGEADINQTEEKENSKTESDQDC